MQLHTRFTPQRIEHSIVDEYANTMVRMLIDLTDKHTVAALKALGWTPPPDGYAIKKEQEAKNENTSCK